MVFYENLATVTETEQIAELRLVASKDMINNIRTAAESDDVYKALMHQISSIHLAAWNRIVVGHAVSSTLVTAHIMWSSSNLPVDNHHFSAKAEHN